MPILTGWEGILPLNGAWREPLPAPQLIRNRSILRTPNWNPNSPTVTGGSIPGGGQVPANNNTMNPWLTAAAIGGSALGGVLSNTQGARTSTSTPTISPEYKTLADLLRSRAEERLRSNFDIGGIRAGGIQGINSVFSGLQQSSENNLTARGLATSPVAATVGTNLNTARGGSIIDFLNTLPAMQRQFQNQDMTAGQDILRSGTGLSSVGAGSALGSGLGSAAEMLALLRGMGAI